MKRKKSSFDQNFDRVVVWFLLVFLLIVAYPLYFVVIASISSPSMVVSGQVTLFPRGFSLGGYRRIIEYTQIWIGYRNTIVYVILQTLLSVTVTMMASYALSRKKYAGRTAITIFLTIPMYFSAAPATEATSTATLNFRALNVFSLLAMGSNSSTRR